jgi:hypothetical protein
VATALIFTSVSFPVNNAMWHELGNLDTNSRGLMANAAERPPLNNVG